MVIHKIKNHIYSFGTTNLDADVVLIGLVVRHKWFDYKMVQNATYHFNFAFFVHTFTNPGNNF
jgi:hypothetical protein